MCNRYRLSPSDHAKLAAQGVGVRLPDDRAEPAGRPLHPAAIPVILHEEDWPRWLDAPVEDALSLAAPYPSQLMRVE